MSAKTTPLAKAIIDKAIAEKATRLDLGCCGLTQIPDEVFTMTWLEELDLANYAWSEEQNDMISKISDGVDNLLSFIPVEIKNLSSLKVFNLSGYNPEDDYLGKIEKIPLNVLPESLLQLDISHNKISKIEGLESLTALIYLDLDSNQIQKIEGLEHLTALTTLRLDSNRIKKIEGLESLTALTDLWLYSNQIQEIEGLEKLTVLTNLNLHSNRIEKTEGLEKLTALIKLNLRSNRIEKIEGLEKLTALTGLSLDFNRIEKIEGLKSLSALTNLSLHSNQIIKIEGLENLTALTYLNLGSNQIQQIEGLESLAALTGLSLDSNRIEKIEGLESLAALTGLSLNSNRIKKIEGLESLSALTSLFLISNRIEKIEGLESLTSLTNLFLDSNQIQQIERLESLSVLNHLSLNSNQIQQIEGLESLAALTSLRLDSNRIEKIEGLENLTALTYLSLDSNQIQQIEGLESLAALTGLSLNSNRIKKIEGLESLSALTNLSFDFNRIEKIEGLESLSALTYLNLGSNRIEKIEGLESLSVLTHLSLETNFLDSAYALQNIPSLNKLQLRGNPLKDIPQGILETSFFGNCLSDIVSWWKEVVNPKEVDRNTLIKLQVIGNGNTGKSSLIEALQQGKCRTVFESTHGVLLTTLKFGTNDAIVQFQVWDFGGQEIYHGTHKLFIASESIQLLVTDAETERLAAARELVADRVTKDQMVLHQPLRHYVELARKQSPSSVIVVVQNKVGTGMKRDKKIYAEAAAENLDFYAVSATEGTGIETLKGLLVDKAKGLLHYGMLMPKSWQSVQQFFLDNLCKRETERKKLMPQAEFESVCRQFAVMEKSVSSLLKLLHHSGLVYTNPRILKDEIITDQRWALEAIYKILDRSSDFYDDMHKDYRGRVRAKIIFRAFGNDYSPEEKWLFLRFMQSCGLCFSLNAGGKGEDEDSYFIFPQFLPKEETPAVTDLWKKAADVKTYRYKLDYLDYYRIQKFIVDIGTKTKLENIWKYGIAVDTDKGLFRVEVDRDNPGIVVTIEASAEATYLLQIVSVFSNDRNKANDKWTIGTDADSRKVLDIEALKRRASATDRKQTEAIPNRMETPKIERELAKEQNLKNTLPDVEQSRPKRIVISFASQDLETLKELKRKLSNYTFSGNLEVKFDADYYDGKDTWQNDLQEMFEEADGFIMLVSEHYQNWEEKRYIWMYEVPLIEKRFKEEHIPAWTLTVSPVVDYNPKLEGFVSFRGKACLPEKGNERTQFLVDFAKEIIGRKFLNLQ